MNTVAQEGIKVKPIPPPTSSHFTDRKTSRTDLTGLKPAEDFFFLFPPFPQNFFFLSVLLSFFIPSSFLYFLFFLPAFFYLFFNLN